MSGAFDIKLAPAPVVPPTVEFDSYVLYPGTRNEVRRIIQGAAPAGCIDVALTQDLVGVRSKTAGLEVVWPWHVIRGAINVPVAKGGTK